MALHIIQTSPYSTQAYNNCLDVITEQDVIVLTQDAVYLCSSPLLKNRGPTIYALKDDLKDRGVDPNTSVRVIEYEDFVELTSQFSPCVNWG